MKRRPTNDIMCGIAAAAAAESSATALLSCADEVTNGASLSSGEYEHLGTNAQENEVGTTLA